MKHLSLSLISLAFLNIGTFAQNTTNNIPSLIEIRAHLAGAQSDSHEAKEINAQAASQLAQIINDDPTNLEAKFVFAQTLINLENFQNAKVMLDFLVKTEPSNFLFIASRAELNAFMNRTDDFIFDFSKALEIGEQKWAKDIKAKATSPTGASALVNTDALKNLGMLQNIVEAITTTSQKSKQQKMTPNSQESRVLFFMAAHLGQYYVKTPENSALNSIGENVLKSAMDGAEVAALDLKSARDFKEITAAFAYYIERQAFLSGALGAARKKAQESGNTALANVLLQKWASAVASGDEAGTRIEKLTNRFAAKRISQPASR